MIKRETPNTRLDLCSRMDLHICTYINACVCTCACVYVYVPTPFNKVHVLKSQLATQFTIQNDRRADFREFSCSHQYLARVYLWRPFRCRTTRSDLLWGGQSRWKIPFSFSLSLSLSFFLAHAHSLSLSLFFPLSLTTLLTQTHTSRVCIYGAPFVAVLPAATFFRGFSADEQSQKSALCYFLQFIE